ncbi:MAG: NUDIX hydrolase [Deltaproteobacteria bacterium]|nr:MAG: NUDIX hydrolase [Deltaproteobacteria bacterium]
MSSGNWKKLSSDIVAKTPLFTMKRERVVNPRNDHEFDAYVMDLCDWVNVIAITPKREMIFVRQYRHGISRDTLEIPGGVVDPGEKAGTAAVRELLEETGYSSERVHHIGTVDAQPAIQNNALHTYLVLDAELTAELAQDHGEDLKVELHPLDSLDQLVLSGEISHSMMLTAFHWLTLYSRKNGCL